jgi:ABC-type transporter Mla subunit MlaD
VTTDPGSGSPMSERMQALLSRAVEDQLSEQRQLAGAIGEFRSQVGRLAQEMEQIRSAPSEATASLEASVAAVAGEVREAVRLLGERLDAVSGLVRQRGQDLSELRSVVGDVQGSVANHAAALGGVAGGLAALPSFGDRIGALQDTVAGLHDRLRGLEEMTGAVAAVQQRVDGIDTAVRELRGAFAGIAARVADLPARGDVDAIVARAAEPLRGVDDRLGGVDDRLGGVDDRLGRLEAALPSLLERLDALAKGSGGHAEQLSGMQAQLDEVIGATRVDDSDLPERLAAVETSIATVRDRVDEMVHTPSRDPRVDELMGSVDELHEGLFGDDGLAAQLRTYAEAPPPATADSDERVAAAVQEAVADSERRLAEHIDEAVLALAEALLRRKSGRVQAPRPQWPAEEELAEPAAPVDPAPPVGPAPLVDPTPPIDTAVPAATAASALVAQPDHQAAAVEPVVVEHPPGFDYNDPLGTVATSVEPEAEWDEARAFDEAEGEEPDADYDEGDADYEAGDEYDEVEAEHGVRAEHRVEAEHGVEAEHEAEVERDEADDDYDLYVGHDGEPVTPLEATTGWPRDMAEADPGRRRKPWWRPGD